MGGSLSGPASIASFRRREVLTLSAYAIALLVCAVPLASMLVGAWDAEGLGFHLVWGLVRTFDLHIDAAVVFPFGLFVGLLIVLWFDDVKRIQAVLLTAAVVIAGGALWLWRWGVNVSFLEQGHVLVGGILLGFLGAGGHRVITEEPLREFRGAFRGMYVGAGLLVVGSFFERHVRYVSPIQRTADGMTPVGSGLNPGLAADGIVLHAVATLAFVGILREFVRYEDARDIAVLGPVGGGKTTMMTGLFRYATASGSTRCTPEDANYELRELFAEMDARPGFGEINEGVEGGTRFVPLSFEFMHGDLFSRYVTARMADHRGELITERFADAIRSATAGHARTSRLRRVVGGGVSWPDRRTETTDGELEERMAELVVDSDTLALVVPMADFLDDVNPDRLPEYHDPTDRHGRPGPATYLPLLDDVVGEYLSLPGDRDVMVIVTMCDLAVEEFERENPGAIVEDYEEFRSYIRHRVFVIDEAGSGFEHYTDDVYPFFFRMEPDGTPRTDARDVYGASEILDRIAKR